MTDAEKLIADLRASEEPATRAQTATLLDLVEKMHAHLHDKAESLGVAVSLGEKLMESCQQTERALEDERRLHAETRADRDRLQAIQNTLIGWADHRDKTPEQEVIENFDTVLTLMNKWKAVNERVVAAEAMLRDAQDDGLSSSLDKRIATFLSEDTEDMAAADPEEEPVPEPPPVVLPTKYPWQEGMREISGFKAEGSAGGANYEEACRIMVRAGLEWFDAHPEAEPRFTSFRNIFGLVNEDNEDAKQLAAAMTAAADAFNPKGGVSGAMMHATTNHVMTARKLGWDAYVLKMKER